MNSPDFLVFFILIFLGIIIFYFLYLFLCLLTSLVFIKKNTLVDDPLNVPANIPDLPDIPVDSSMDAPDPTDAADSDIDSVDEDGYKKLLEKMKRDH